MDDLISRQAAINALGERPLVWTNSDYEIAQRNQWDVDMLAIETVPAAQPEQRWILCVDGNEPKANADCWISTNAKYVRRAIYAPKAYNQPNGFIVTEGGFEFYEYGKSAKAWRPYDLPEPYRGEGGENANG